MREAFLSICVEHRLVVTDSGSYGVVGRLDVQRGTQRLIERINGIEGAGVFVEFVADVVSIAHSSRCSAPRGGY